LTLPTNSAVTKAISDPHSKRYVDLARFLTEFQYPVSLELSKYIGKRAYENNSCDPLEFFCVLTTKVYSTIIPKGDTSVLTRFLLDEKAEFKDKVSRLISSAKGWETGKVNDEGLARSIETFCRETTSVRLPVASFFLRMLVPRKFGTLDKRVTRALKSLGFQGIKDIPDKEKSIEEYLRKYSGFDYLEYNTLLTEIGKQYSVPSEAGGRRALYPSEVDMALYTYDKIGNSSLVPPMQGSLDEGRREKIDALMTIVKEIVNDVIDLSKEPWASKNKDENEVLWSKRLRGSGIKLMSGMRKLAEEGNLEGMLSFYINSLASERGTRVGKTLKDRGKKSLESEYAKVIKIYYGH